MCIVEYGHNRETKGNKLLRKLFKSPGGQDVITFLLYLWPLHSILILFKSINICFLYLHSVCIVNVHNIQARGYWVIFCAHHLWVAQERKKEGAYFLVIIRVTILRAWQAHMSLSHLSSLLASRNPYTVNGIYL